ncbi:hypothetical protein Tco_1190114, partial [Tanacetum coccineum]
MDDQDMFDVNADLQGDEVVADEEVVSAAANVEVTIVSTPTTTIDEMTLAQNLIEIKAAKPKAITTAATTVTAVVTRPKTKGVVMQEPFETLSPKLIVSSQNLSQPKDKGKVEKSSMMKAQESSVKRGGAELEQEKAKKQKLDENVEVEVDDFAELKSCLEIVLEDKDDVTVDATPLSSKSPSIIDYKIHKEGKRNYFQIIGADGNSKIYLTFRQMFKNFNRDDLENLWKIVKSRFKKTGSVDDMDKLLLRTLNTMFEPQVEDT